MSRGCLDRARALGRQGWIALELRDGLLEAYGVEVLEIIDRFGRSPNLRCFRDRIRIYVVLDIHRTLCYKRGQQGAACVRLLDGF